MYNLITILEKEIKTVARRAYSFSSGMAYPGEARQSEDGSPEEKIMSV
jgi:hypothetical protein